MRLKFTAIGLALFLLISMPSMAKDADTFNVLVKLKGDTTGFASNLQAKSGETRAQAALSAALIRKNKVREFVSVNNIQPRFVFSHTFFGFYAALTNAQLDSLEKNPDVEYIEEERPPLRAYQQRDEHLPFLEFPEVSILDRFIFYNGGIGTSEKFKGKGVHVYVFDTGIDSDHKDIAANLGEAFASAPCDHKTLCPTPYEDRNGHGTHVAGIVGAIDNDIDVVGVAPQSTIHPVKVCNDEGGCGIAEAIQGLEWAVADMLKRGKPAVGNMSFGGYAPNNEPGRCLATGYAGTDIFAEAICNAALQGMVTVTSAGNSSADAKYFIPAQYNSVITVSAFYQNILAKEKVVYPEFSNYGTGLNPWNKKESGVVTIAAPGLYIRSLNRTHGDILMDGTSMAAPMVAGGAALVLEAIPQLMDISALVNVRQLLVDNAYYCRYSSTPENPDIYHDEGSLNISFLDKL